MSMIEPGAAQTAPAMVNTWVRGADMAKSTWSVPDPQKFWAKVVKDDDGCWVYQGPFGRRGYGVFHTTSGYVRAHRVSFFLANGRLPGLGLDVCHTCDNPPCVRPDHLWEGTRAENNADMWAKGRHGPFTPVGEAHPLAKLTWADVAAIREAHLAGESQRSIAGRFPVSRPRIRLILSGRAWSPAA
jgi:hypothetical protein